MDNKYFRAMQEARVVIVTGPPGSGKTTYARQNRRTGDIVIDVDHIAAALMLSDTISKDYSEVLSAALLIRDKLIDAIAENQLTYGRAFIITTDNARKIQNRTGGRIVTIDPGIEETMRRIDSDASRDPDQRMRRRDLALKYYYQRGPKRK